MAQNAVAAYCEDVIDEEDRGPASRTDVAEHTVNDMLQRTDGYEGEGLAGVFGGALNKAPGTTKLKAEACVEAARGLQHANVNVRADLRDPARLLDAKSRWKAVRGLGQQSWSYFTMLAGVEDWKVDTWVRRFVIDAVGRDVSAVEGRDLLDAAIDDLQADHDTELSRRAIDHAIWRAKSGRSPR